MSDGSIFLSAYRLATGAAEPFAPLVLRARLRQGKEDRYRLNERLGRARLVRPDGPLVWLHGASVGEGLSLLPVVEALRVARPDVTVLVTTGTKTSADLLTRRLPKGAIHQYLPVDTPRAAARFLDHWRPDVVVFAESELWPNLLGEARRRGVKMALLSAKLSEQSFRNWSRSPAAAKALLGGFALVLAQDARAAQRLAALGAKVVGEGDLKFGAEPLPADPAVLAALRARLGDRPVVLAASTHTGEDELVVNAFKAVLAKAPEGQLQPLLVITPRHPVRAGAIVDVSRVLGVKSTVHSLGGVPGDAPMHVVDTLGELGLWFRLARLTIMGGSLISGLAGHNPLEPARLDCPVIHGPHVANWTTAYTELDAAGAAACVTSPEALEDFIAQAVEGSAALTAMAERAHAYVAEKDEAARKLPARILELLP